MFDDLTIIDYPDPRLLKVSDPVSQFDESLVELGTKMLLLMREAKGVGLAAPQVGINRRLFVMNATGKPEDDLIVVNPELSEMEGSEEAEEGCLSVPELRVQIDRANALPMATKPASGSTSSIISMGYC